MGRVIRSGRVIEGEVYDARAEARRLVAEARAEAERITADADAARERGRQEGLAAGRDAAIAGVAELLLRARLEAGRRADEAEDDLRRLAVKIAEKILGRELALAPGAVVDVVRAALAAARARRQLVVRVHPDDAAAVAAARPALAEALARTAELALRPDPTVPRGGCLIDTEVGTIDARLDVQLAAIERALVSGGS